MRALILLLAACNGGGGKPPGSGATPTSGGLVDDDQDGFALPGDCDDRDPSVHPGAEDPPYDGIDQNCDEASDNDADQDGFDDAGHGGDDCDDQDDLVFPGALETCNDVDDDCNQLVDDGAAGADPWYPDVDQDGYGDQNAQPTLTCVGPEGFVEDATDCDDDDATVWPGAGSIGCDGKDNDCSAITVEVGEVRVNGQAVADLAAALELPTDTIELCEGTHAADTLTIDHAVTITGSGSAITRIDAGGQPLIEVTTADAVVFEGVTLTGGIGWDSAGVRQGGALWLGDDAYVTGYDLWIDGNAAGLGGGVWMSTGSALVLVGGGISNNTGLDKYAVVASGGGIYAEDLVTITLDGAAVEENEAMSCGGMDLGAAVIVDGVGTGAVRSNIDRGLGGGGICAMAGGTFVGLEISGNTALNAGGGLRGIGVWLEDVDVLGNTSDLNGGGLDLSGDNTLLRVTLQANDAGIDGGGVFQSSGSLLVQEGVVELNNAFFFAAKGGGVALFQSTLSSVDTNWSAMATDNLPADVSLTTVGVGFSWDGVASFVCDDTTSTCQ